MHDNDLPAARVWLDRFCQYNGISTSAGRPTSSSPSTKLDTIEHHVVRQDDAADIELGTQTIVWRFDDTKLVEMLNLIEPLVDIIKPAHNYFDDLNSPDATLILSVDRIYPRRPIRSVSPR